MRRTSHILCTWGYSTLTSSNSRSLRWMRGYLTRSFQA
jgi:hypothetical protein